MPRILCVDDDPAVLMATEEVLEDAGYEVVGVRNAEAARSVLARGGVDLVVSDYRLPGASGLELLEQLKDDGIDVPVVIVTGYASIDHAVTTIKAGAIDYLTKPIRPGQLEVVVSQALELVNLRRQNAVLRGQVSSLSAARSVVGDSEPLQRVIEAVRTAAPTRATVLLEGESGTGKELIARMLHDMSGRSDEAFVSVNCAALPEHLVESTLFGHEKGAFTGATRRTEGAFERAHRGTLLLDEVSEMRLDLQAKLLRALQEQEFERVGGTSPIRVDVRVVATTNRDLKAEVDAGNFRADLYYRLNVLPMRIPPLRERIDDVPALVTHFAVRSAKELGRSTPVIDRDALAALQAHDWPGNVRELGHIIERAVIFAADGRITAENVQIGGQVTGGDAGAAPPTTEGGTAEAGDGEVVGTGGHSPSAGRGASAEDGDASVHLDTFDIGAAEAALIAAALERTDGNRTQAAKLLGISIRTLRNKLNNPRD